MTLIVLGLAVAASVFLSGGVQPSQWNWCLLAIGLTTAIARIKNPPIGRLDTLLLGTIAGTAVIQIVPLPIAWVGLLSPARAELAQAVSAVAGSPVPFVTLSAVPLQTAQYILTLCGYGTLFLAIRAITTSCKSLWTPIWPLLAVAAIEAILGVFQAPFAHGTYASRDHYAGLLEMILPFVVMYPLAILKRNLGRRQTPSGPVVPACAILAIAGLILVAILDSTSRMGFIVALAVLFVCAWMALSVRWRILAVAVLVLGLIFLPGDPLLARFSHSSDQVRLQIWRDTPALIEAFPIFGCGLGGYESCFYRFKTVAPMYTVDYAHNDYMQILAEFGIIAFLAGMIFAGRLVLTTLRRALHAPSADGRFLAIACTGSLVAILLHSLVDFNLYVPANSAIFAWVCGISAAARTDDAHPLQPRSNTT